MKMKINVLGTEYTLTVCGDEKESRLVGCDGICDETTKEMFVESYDKNRDDPTCKANLRVQTNKVKRHEIILMNLSRSRTMRWQRCGTVLKGGVKSRSG